jgi:arginase family enzyme
MLGVRDVWPEAERERLDRSAIRVVEWVDGKPRGEVSRALDALKERVDEVYLHLDFDGLDPRVAPGIVDDPVPGGLSLEDAEAAIRSSAERFRIRAATFATFTPERDVHGKTLGAALRLLGLLGEYASRIDS